LSVGCAGYELYYGIGTCLIHKFADHPIKPPIIEAEAISVLFRLNTVPTIAPAIAPQINWITHAFLKAFGANSGAARNPIKSPKQATSIKRDQSPK